MPNWSRLIVASVEERQNNPPVNIIRCNQGTVALYWHFFKGRGRRTSAGADACVLHPLTMFLCVQGDWQVSLCSTSAVGGPTNQLTDIHLIGNDSIFTHLFFPPPILTSTPNNLFQNDGNGTYDEHFRRLQDEAFVRPADADATPLTKTAIQQQQ